MKPFPQRSHAIRFPGGTQTFAPLGLYLLAGFSSLAVAAGVTHASPLATTALVLMVVVTPLVVRRPELGVLAFVFLTAAVPRDALFEHGIPFFGGALKVTDLLLVLTVGAWAATALVGMGQRLPSSSTAFLLAGALLLAGLGVITAHGHGTPTKMSMLELRPLLSFLLVLPVVAGLRSMRDARRAIYTLLVACAIAGVLVVWRYLHGEGGVASYTGGATRVGDSLFMFPMIASIWVAVLLPTARGARSRLLLAALGLLSVAALFFTFQRGAWVAFLVGLGLVALRLRRDARRRLVVALVVLSLASVAAIFALNSASVSAVHDPLRAGWTRLASVSAVQSDVSGRYRLAEWSAAYHAISEHPVTGIGLGSTISFWSPMYSDATHRMGGVFSTMYIHNSYVWYALKLGLPAALFFVALIVLSALRAGCYARDRPTEGSDLALGAAATLLTILVVSATGPHLSADFSTPYIAAVIGFVEAFPRLAGRTRNAAVGSWRTAGGSEP